VDTIEHEVWIKAPNAAVFKALTTREGLDGWWGSAVRAEPKIGSVVEFDHGHGDLLRMRITELTEHERVVWRCVSDFVEPGNPASEWLGHRLSFDLTSASDDDAFRWLGSRLFESASPADVTILRFRQTGWAPDSRWFAFCNYGWGWTFADLRNYCESGASQDP
jgi:uncharacterized protein YndB with AHSA1/START domain